MREPSVEYNQCCVTRFTSLQNTATDSLQEIYLVILKGNLDSPQYHEYHAVDMLLVKSVDIVSTLTAIRPEATIVSPVCLTFGKVFL